MDRRAYPDALSRSETHLALLGRECERTTIDRWRMHCTTLDDAVASPSTIPVWLRRLPTAVADEVLRDLVAMAQDEDPVALLTVVVCLAPGIRALAARSRVPTDEVVSEVALGILDFPYRRRGVVAAGLLLDARNRIHRAHQRAARFCPLDDSRVPPHDLAEPTLAATERIVQLVCQAHRQGLLDRTDAELILCTRVAGHRVKPLAGRLGLTPSAAYQRRSRAEARLAALVA